MTDSEDVVIVEHNDAPPELTEEHAKVTPSGSNNKTVEIKPHMETVSSQISSQPDSLIALGEKQAYQIVSVGNEANSYAFKFEREKFQEILARIPSDCRVAVISVVGAFRTGKSFLLTWFLRYLHFLQKQTKLGKDYDANTGEIPWYETFDKLTKDDGFDWRGGSDRNTTGIWMWSHPHILHTKDGESLAVLLVDTQGMFDHETTMALTASIFGLSTLLSSYQIYNVDKQIQEDNLQQLALFSEYARMAVVAEHDDAQSPDDYDPSNAHTGKPFQRIEFLVRDWQHFDEDLLGDDGVRKPDYEALEASMESYLEKAIANRDAKDLQETREQIVSCFEAISCFGLCHPGLAVTKKTYVGDVKSIEPLFLQLLDRYCRRVFDTERFLEPKVIHGRHLTAPELGSYVEAYAELFASGAKFPTASTLLEATASANNTNAVNKALQIYKDSMNRVSGPRCSNYLRPEELNEEHVANMRQSLVAFDAAANFGSRARIEESRRSLLDQIESSFDVYHSLNEGRNPLAGLETYLIPMSIAFAAVALRWLTDMTCSPYSQYCRAASEVFSHAYAVVFFFLMIVAVTKAQQIKDLFLRLKKAFEVMASNSSGPSPGKSKSE